MADQTVPSSESQAPNSDSATTENVTQGGGPGKATVASPNTIAVPIDNRKSSGKGLSVVAVLLSLMALGGSGFTIYQSHFTEQSTESRLVTGVNTISSDVKVLAERMNQLQRSQQQVEQSAVTQDQMQTRLLEVNNQSDLALRDIKQGYAGLQSTLEKLTANTERGADKLALDEVSQLLKLANNSVVFSRDRVSAINALKIADSQLQQLADPRYSTVRRAINEEINQLDAIKSADVPSLTAKLSAIGEKISSLPLENEPPVAGQVTIAKPIEESEMTITSEFKKLWVMVVNTVKIKRVDQPPKPLLEPEQRYFLDHNIQLKLNTAELAVLQNRSGVYQRSIESALAWLLDYYDPRDESVKATVAELRALQTESLGSELPSIAGSYDALQRIRGGN